MLSFSSCVLLFEGFLLNNTYIFHFVLCGSRNTFYGSTFYLFFFVPASFLQLNYLDDIYDVIRIIQHLLLPHKRHLLRLFFELETYFTLKVEKNRFEKFSKFFLLFLLSFFFVFYFLLSTNKSKKNFNLI